MVRPSVSYASVVWAHDTLLQKTCRCLNGLNRLALKSIAHSARSCPTRGRAVVLDLLPLPLHLQRTAMHSALRYPDIVNMSWPGHSSTKRHTISHRAYWSGLLHSSDVPSANDYLRAVNPLLAFG